MTGNVATFRNVMAAILVVACSACASYISKQNTPGAVESGLVYYMPMRPIIVQIAVTLVNGETIETPSIAPADAIPDLTRRFVLADQDDLIAENHVVIGVSERGLLQSANSTATSGLDIILKNMAIAAGEASAIGARGLVVEPTNSPSPDLCVAGRIYNYVIWPPNLPTAVRLCGFTVSVDNNFETAQLKSDEAGDDPKLPTYNPNDDLLTGASGIFYKTEVPYLVTLKPDGGDASSSISFLAYSPDAAPISFLPIKRILFAKNTVNLTLTDGELKSFDQENSGELAGLSVIPADVLDAYFTAISKIVPEITTANSDRNTLAISDLQRKLCAAAIIANPIDGKSNSDQLIAYNNIKSACSNN